MNKYKRLILNIFIFAVGSFSSKIFALILNNLYTKRIDPASFYTKSLIETLALFLIPVFTFSMTEAVIRFGLDDAYNKKKVFTTATCIIAFGMALMAAIVPFLHFIPVLRQISGYSGLLCIYVFASSMRALCSQFARSRNLVKIFSFDGIATTVTLFIFSLIFISYMDLGVKGFMLATILSDSFSAMFLFLAASIRKYFDLRCIDRRLGEKMLRFAVPLIPTTVMWTLTGFSDQIFISNMHSSRVQLGEAAAGIYSAATKVPNLLSMVATIFSMAWNMSAITENRSKDKHVFYSNVFDAYQSVLFLGAAGLILLVKPVSMLLININTFPEYGRAYLYTPLLITAAVFVCLNHFEYGIYTATKHSRNAFYTVAAALCSNLTMNAVFIPLIGIQGASLATCCSYIICFIIRMQDIQRFEPFSYSKGKLILNTFLLFVMCGCVIAAQEEYFLITLIPGAVLILLNIKPMLLMIRKLINRKRA
ncbi:MAG: polysaccharide biosynthesis C-terminal domain-containing protein [Ruminococcus sp.]|nr:polysaccharide biosynthesis C-terminal domain-containing protein [Ruminococcus sp.]MBR6968783.1 polysaccharide biosynthesis C-terminal domain-containing protein [Ruminococcus sp.]